MSKAGTVTNTRAPERSLQSISAEKLLVERTPLIEQSFQALLDNLVGDFLLLGDLIELTIAFGGDNTDPARLSTSPLSSNCR